MKRKYLIGVTIAIAMMASACNGKTETKVPTETIETTQESIRETTIKSDADDEHIQTLGIYRSSTESTAANGPYILATFTDSTGNDFVATISKDTVSTELIEGKTYIVEHSDIMTMSLPGIYPQVYSISESDEELVISVTEEYETGYAKADGYVEEIVTK